MRARDLAARAPHIHVIIPLDPETEALRARHTAIGRRFSPIAAMIPALIFPPIAVLAALIMRACLPALIAQVF